MAVPTLRTFCASAVHRYFYIMRLYDPHRPGMRLDYRDYVKPTDEGLIIDFLATNGDFATCFLYFLRGVLHTLLEKLSLDIFKRSVELISNVVDVAMAEYIDRELRKSFGELRFDALPYELRDFALTMCTLLDPSVYRPDTFVTGVCCQVHMQNTREVAKLLWIAHGALFAQLDKAKEHGITIGYIPPLPHFSPIYSVKWCEAVYDELTPTHASEILKTYGYDRYPYYKTYERRCRNKFVTKAEWLELEAKRTAEAHVRPPKRGASVRARVFINRALKKARLT